MSNEALISTISQLQAEVETLGLRGLRAASAEQLQWLRHTRDSLSEMGAEFLAAKMTQLLASMEQTQSDAAARLLDLLTTIRVFDRVLTMQTVESILSPLCDENDERDSI